MPCVYLPGPAPAVTVANSYKYSLKIWLMKLQRKMKLDSMIED